MVPSPAAQAFVADLLTWCRSAREDALVRAFRSPYSGVPHDVAAAYATLSARIGPLLDAIARERLALPAADRDALFAFTERLRTLCGIDDDAAFRGRCAELFPALGEAPESDAQATPLVLAEAQSREIAGGVRAHQKHFSASALNAYVECARKWFYRYVCSAVEDAGSSASVYGTAFHAALEDFHGEYPEPRPEDEREMRLKLEGYVNWAFERYREEFDTAVEVELQKRRAQRTARRYIDWLVAEAKRAPFTVIGRESPVNLDLDGFAFVGYIDRLDRDNATGSIAIFDYKTGAIATSAQEYREKVRTFRDFQLPFYYWARTAEGDRVSRLALIPLKDALLDVRPVALEVVPMAPPDDRRRDSASGVIPINELERARTRMVEICSELTSGELRAFPVASDPSACTYCAYVTACADRPHAERERFGR